jgi:hypothetical protein
MFTIGITAATMATAPVAAWQQAPATPGVELSQKETELRVRAETARRLGVRTEDVRLIEVSARVWPDAGLGCNARRGVLESSPVHGFRIIAEAADRRLTFHTDRHGRLLRCTLPAKPIDRIK